MEDRRKITQHIVLCLLLTQAFLFVTPNSAETPAVEAPTPVAENPSPVPGYSPQSSAPVGVSAVARIEYNLGYVFEVTGIYEAKITLLEIVRGEKAWNRIKAADSSNQPPEVGFEYILAHIRFELTVTEDLDRRGYKLRAWRFSAMSSAGKYYDTPAVVPPQPELRADLKPGDSYEGWAVFQVAVDDDKPLVNFGRTALSNDDGYLGVWFQLY